MKELKMHFTLIDEGSEVDYCIANISNSMEAVRRIKHTLSKLTGTLTEIEQLRLSEMLERIACGTRQIKTTLSNRITLKVILRDEKAA